MGGSEQSWNDDGTTFHQSDPSPCTNGCGFFGTAATNGLCSKCYRYLRNEEELAITNKSAVRKSYGVVVKEDLTSSAAAIALPVTDDLILSTAAAGKEIVSVNPNRCGSCRKKVGLTGFKCKCGITYCGTHRYPETHDCEFDFKKKGRDAIEKSNPVIIADKLNNKI